MNQENYLIDKFIAEVEDEGITLGHENLDTDNVELTELQKVNLGIPVDYEPCSSQMVYNNQPNMTRVNGSSNSSAYNNVSNEQFALSEVEKDKIKSLLDRWNMNYLFQTCISE